MARRADPGAEFRGFVERLGLTLGDVATVCDVPSYRVLEWAKRGAPVWAVAVVGAAGAFGMDSVDPSEVARARELCERRA